MYRFSTSVPSEFEHQSNRTLFISDIPINLARRRHLVSWFGINFPDVSIEGIQHIYETEKLEHLYTEYVNLTNAAKYCEEYLDKNNVEISIRPFFLGRTCVCCCYQCPEIDGLTYYRRKAMLIEAELEKLFKKTVDNPSGSIFITFKTDKMAKTVYNALRGCQCCAYLPTQIIFNIFRKDDGMGSWRWQVHYAPDPDDVNWMDISSSPSMVWLRFSLMNILLFIIFGFMTTPPIIFSLIHYLPYDTLEEWATSNFPFLAKYLSSLLLIIASSALPSIVTLAAVYLPYNTISEMNHSIMWHSYFFLVLMVLILPSLGFTTASEVINSWLSDNQTKFNWHCLFPVDDGAFFINYVLQAALIGNAVELLRIPEFLLYFFFTIFCNYSAAEYSNSRKRVSFDFYFGTRYARFLLIFCMVVSYSITSPLIAPCGKLIHLQSTLKFFILFLFLFLFSLQVCSTCT